MSTAIIQRATIDEIVGHRNQAISLFGQAFELLQKGFDAAAKSAGGARFHVDRDQAHHAFSAYSNDQSKFLDQMRKLTDRAAWDHLIRGYGFEKLMDRQAMQEFRDQLVKDPPILEVDVAHATLAQLMTDADHLFRRGVANAFSKLDRRFRSHDGFKIGDRIVLDRAFGADSGSWNYHAAHQDTIRDIERAFYTLDDREMPESYAGIIGVIDTERQRHPYGSPAAFVVEDEYFRVRSFKNGNVHLWFKRDELLEKVNKLLAEYYGEVLGAGSDAVEDDPLSRPNTSLAKNLGWFPTPPVVADRVVNRASLYWPRPRDGEPKPDIRILEPSAGEGALIGAVLDHIQENMRGENANLHVACVEIHSERSAKLRADPRIHEVVQTDFLLCTPAQLGVFDRIIMNPPFDRERDIDHVAHAAKFLAPGGYLVAVMSAGVEFRTTRKAQAFRKLVEQMQGDIFDLPPGSFEASGTLVNTCIVVLRGAWS